MSAAPQGNTSDRSSSPPHLVSLVLQSKKALQQGEQLCSHAHELTVISSNHAVDVLALDAKIRWITQGILDQIKVAACVAKSITARRQKLEEEAKDWDNMRSQHQDALDATLEVLGVQVVPPSFHQSALEFSLFGIQASDNPAMEDEEANANNTQSDDHQDARKKWKTLRDFVDERGLEDVFESIEGERSALDDILSTTATYPGAILLVAEEVRHALNASLNLEDLDLTQPSSKIIQSPTEDKTSLIEPPPLKDIAAILLRQEDVSTGMAGHLESLAAHYDQMATALKDKDSGGDLGEEDMDVFIRDTTELPVILNELEQSIAVIQTSRDEILAIKSSLQTTLDAQACIINSLDVLADKMEVMLQEQSDIEAEIQVTYGTMNDYLQSLIALRSTYETYQFSYNALIIEMDRRRRRRDEVESIVQGWKEQLEAFREEEIMARDSFYAAHSSSIPDDLCLAISNLPQSYSIASSCKNSNDETQYEREILPEIDEDILEDAHRRYSIKPLSRREDSLQL